MADFISSSRSYQDLLARLKSQIRTAQVRAAVAGSWFFCIGESGKRFSSGSTKKDGCESHRSDREPLARLTWYNHLTLIEKLRALRNGSGMPAQQLLKDPYNFDFLTLTQEAQERDLERGLLAHLRQFLIELGVGFAFVRSQVPLEIGGEDFKLDLVFYHLKLRCFVIIDLKMGSFKPEYAGKMNFYLSAVDDLLRH